MLLLYFEHVYQLSSNSYQQFDYHDEFLHVLLLHPERISRFHVDSMSNSVVHPEFITSLQHSNTFYGKSVDYESIRIWRTIS